MIYVIWASALRELDAIYVTDIGFIMSSNPRTTFEEELPYSAVSLSLVPWSLIGIRTDVKNRPVSRSRLAVRTIYFVTGQKS